MCEVTGQVVSSRPASDGSMSVSEASSRIMSGTWQEALTMASKAVRATETRRPASRSCASRRSRETALPSAIKTRGDCPSMPALFMALTPCAVVRIETSRPLTPGVWHHAARMLPGRLAPVSLIGWCRSDRQFGRFAGADGQKNARQLRSARLIPTAIRAPTTIEIESTSVICPRGSKSATSNSPTKPPTIAVAVISAATNSGRRGHLCDSVRCPLHRGQVAIRVAGGDTIA